MTIEEAKKILMEHRPDRPYKTEGRRYQKAIDIIIEHLDKEIKHE